jgi:hypothetical protein
VQTRLRVGAACCGLIVWAGTACGGGGGRLSAPEYTRDASGICATANRAVLHVEIPPLGDARGVARAMGRVIVIQRDSIAGLRALRPPEQLGSLDQRWVALLDQGTDELEQMRAELTDGRMQRAAEYAGKAATLLGRAEMLVAPRGITSCRGPALEVA